MAASEMEVASNSISMVDVLEEENDLEEDARAVLGGSDAKNCTYLKGYVMRQALYACLTCIPPKTGTVSGICLACSLTCHEGHNLIELYTKRNFRCDCGNSRYQHKKCSLEPNKSRTNEANVYNHNFSGKYCTCERPYPDPENQMISEQMIQCIICEDWFHDQHLIGQVPASDDYGEMICHNCTAKHAFLRYYILPVQTDDKVELPPANYIGNGTLFNRKCVLNRKTPTAPVAALFMEEGWRERLCRCEDCKAMYQLEDVSFLVEPNDTVRSYEEMGKALDAGGSNSQYEQGMRALSQMDRVKQLDAIEAYNHMKQQLMDYLRGFAENKKVVQEDDIRKFFSEMESQKPPRGGPPSFF